MSRELRFFTRGGCLPRSGVALLLALALSSEGGPRVTDAAAIRARGLLLVANKGEHTLGIIDPDAGRQLATVEQSGVGSVSAVDLVARKVAVLDLEAWKVERLIDAGALADGLAWAAVKP